MKITTKIALASALMQSIAAPASAAYFEDQQTQMSNPPPRGARVVGNPVRGHRAGDSTNYLPLQIDPAYQYFHNSGIGSQS
ncbi:MAG TPA: hypothetical protein VEH02_11380 [Pseudolabrys sp.]|nr:hypothetical protein [Pseudolabrys sp.]